MIVKDSLLVLLFLVGWRQLVAGADNSMQLKLRLDRFSNPEGRGDNGVCCESVLILNPLSRVVGCQQRCDTYFEIRIYEKSAASSTGRRLLRHIRTQVWDDTNDVTFGGQLKSDIPNPIVVDLTRWNENGYRIQISAYDQDSNNDDLIAEWTRDYSHPTTNSSWNLENRNDIRLKADISSSCMPFYYTSDCSVFCQPNQHSTCDQHTGVRICKPGYSGYRCNIYNPCETVNCYNRGRCQVEGGTTPICVCPPGYHGRRCEFETNECESYPCANGGRCVDLVDGWRCQCPVWYTGLDCSIRIDYCSNVTCMNGGSCHTTPTSYKCQCASGYTGQRCEEEINECLGVQCVHGVCIDSINGFTCQCEAGYSGKNCSVKVNECADNPCVNGGSCVDQVNSYTCNCPSGWTGRTCDTDVDECALSARCGTNGTCHNSPGGYYCNCSAHYVGSHCEVYVNYCDGRPCHHGNCIPVQADQWMPIRGDIKNMFICECYSGYEGDNCELEIDECESQPCMNNGSCTDQMNGFQCTCINGYSGLRCELDPGPCYEMPCKHGATCKEIDINTVQCMCTDQYTGSYCDDKISYCNTSVPMCVHGKCTEVHSGYRCLCDSGYTGANCNITIDFCTSGNSCPHDQICYNSATAAICDAKQVNNSATTAIEANSFSNQSARVPVNCDCQPADNRTICDCRFPAMNRDQCENNSQAFKYQVAREMCPYYISEEQVNCRVVPAGDLSKPDYSKQKLACFTLQQVWCPNQTFTVLTVASHDKVSAGDCMNDTDCAPARFCLTATSGVENKKNQVSIIDGGFENLWLKKNWYLALAAAIAVILLLVLVSICCIAKGKRRKVNRGRRPGAFEEPLDSMADHIYEGTTYFNPVFDIKSPPAVSAFYSEAILKRCHDSTSKLSDLYAEPTSPLSCYTPESQMNDACIYSEPVEPTTSMEPPPPPLPITKPPNTRGGISLLLPPPPPPSEVPPPITSNQVIADYNNDITDLPPPPPPPISSPPDDTLPRFRTNPLYALESPDVPGLSHNPFEHRTQRQTNPLYT